MAWNPTYVQTDTNVLGSPSPDARSKTFAGNVTAGNILFAVAREGGPVGTVSAADTLASSWSKLAEIGTLSVWAAVAAATGACTVTVTWNALSALKALDVFEWTADGATAVTADGSAGASGSASTHSTGNVTNTVADVLALYCFYIAGGHDETGAPSGYAYRKGQDSFGGSGTLGFHHYSRILSVVTTHNPGATTSGAEDSARLVVLIKPTIPPPTVTGTSILGEGATVQGISRLHVVNLDGVARVLSNVALEGAWFIGGVLTFFELANPPSAVMNTARIWAEDNGSGKTRLMCQFPTGGAQQLAIEP